MRKNKIIELISLVFMFSIILTGCTLDGSKDIKTGVGSDMELQSYTSNLPFEMPEVKAPQFANKDFNIADYGAKSDGLTLNTDVFAKAIDDCNQAGGGRVVIPAGTWLTGPIELKSNVNLFVDTGALVIFSGNYNDYKKTDKKDSSPVKGMIFGNNLENIAITGDGVFNGNGQLFRPVKKEKVTDSQWKSLISDGGEVDSSGTLLWPSKESNDINKLNLLSLSNCKQILLDGPSFENSPHFNIDITSSEGVIVRNAKIVNEYWAQNTDGIDISACKNVVIYKDTVNTGDDGICMKSSASKDNEPGLENVVIENCIVNHAHGGFVVGSNTDGGMKNIYVHNCNYIGTDTGLRFKSNIGSGGNVEDVYIDGVNMKNIVSDAIVFDTNYEGKYKKDNDDKQNKRVPQFQNIHISNVICDGADRAVNISGLENMFVKNLDFNNITIKAKTGFLASNTSDIKLNNVKIIPQQGSVFTLKNSDGYEFNNVLCPDGTDNFLSLEGDKTTNIQLANTDTSNAKQAVILGNGVSEDAVKIE